MEAGKEVWYSDLTVLRAGAAMIILSLVVLCFLFFLLAGPSTDVSSGLLAAFGAILAFGSCGMTYKCPGLEKAKVGPVIFQLYNSCGITLVSIPIAVYLAFWPTHEKGFNFEPWGMLAAVDITIISALAYKAVQCIGYTMGPAMWATTGMMVSFVLGKAAFTEPSQDIRIAILAVVLLACGVCGVALARQDDSSTSNQEEFDLVAVEPQISQEGRGNVPVAKSKKGRADDEAPLAVLEDAVPVPTNTKSENGNMKVGILLCLATGLCDGSLLVPYKLQAGATADGAGEERGPPLRATLAYLASFGLSCAVVTPPLVAAWYAGGAILRGRRPSHRNEEVCAADGGGKGAAAAPPRPGGGPGAAAGGAEGGGFVGAARRAWARDPLRARAAALPGLVAGVLWGLGNLFTVFSARHLGMAVGFPLSQTCIVLNVAWGTLFFRELDMGVRCGGGGGGGGGGCAVGRRARRFGGALGLVMAGAILLARYG